MPKYLFLILFLHCFISTSTYGQSILNDDCLKDKILTSTLDSISKHFKLSVYLDYLDSLDCYPILYSKYQGRIISLENGIRFGFFNYQDIDKRNIDQYFRVLKLEVTIDSVFLELYNRLDNLYVINNGKIKDCRIISSNFHMIEY